MIYFLSPCVCRPLKILPTLFFALVDRPVRSAYVQSGRDRDPWDGTIEYIRNHSNTNLESLWISTTLCSEAPTITPYGSSAASANLLLISTARTSPKPRATATVLLPPWSTNVEWQKNDGRNKPKPCLRNGVPATLDSSLKYQQAFKYYCPATAATRCHKEKLCRVSRDAFGFDVVTSVTSVSSVISITLVTSVAPCVSVNQAVLARRANRPASLASWQSQFKQCTSQLGFLSFPNGFTWDRVGPCGNLVIHGTLLQRAFCKQAAGWKTVPGIKFCIKHCFRYSFLKDLLY